MKKVKKNQLKIVIFIAVKNRCILHGRVFVRIIILGHKRCSYCPNFVKEIKFQSFAWGLGTLSYSEAAIHDISSKLLILMGN